MKGKVRLLGKTFPAWIVAAAIIASTAGAATGVVLAGKVTGEITTTVSQALVIASEPVGGPFADRFLGTKSDDGTRFTAGAETNTGDSYTVTLDLANQSGAELTGELTLFGPEGITLSVADGADVINDVVQTGPFTWKFRLLPGGIDPSDLIVTVAFADDLPPGFYAIDGTLKQVSQ